MTKVADPLPPGFSQVLILKGDKVLCFDTLLQVLILEDLHEGQRARVRSVLNLY
jgi:hypothetical protein